MMIHGKSGSGRAWCDTPDGADISVASRRSRKKNPRPGLQARGWSGFARIGLAGREILTTMTL